MDGPVGTKYSKLLEKLLEFDDGVVVAFSGGVDSLLLLHASVEALEGGVGGSTGEGRVEAVIGVAPTLPGEELAQARAFSEKLGVRLHEIETNVMDDGSFTSNPAERCYHCRISLSKVLESIASEGKIVIDGANAEDLEDYRPGIKAADEHGVIHPLIISGFRKNDIRNALRELGYPEAVYGKPSSPCLSSRIPYADEITLKKLARVERAESALRGMGYQELRVRHYEFGERPVAIVEIAGSELGTFDATIRERITNKLRELGFDRVFLDLEGFRSGKLNDFIDTENDQGGDN